MNGLNLNVYKQCTSCIIYKLDKLGVSGPLWVSFVFAAHQDCRVAFLKRA